jgi:flagellar biogenesis protein FliO
MDQARSLAGVVAVFVLLGLLLWISRRKGAIFGAHRAKPGLRTLELLERVPLSANHSVHLLRVGNRTLLVGTHSSGLTLLCELQPPGLPGS